METEKKLMTVDELLRLPFEDFILITAGQYPYRGRKLMYYLDPRFKDRVKLPTLANWSDQLQELPKRRLQLPWLSENALVVLKKNTATAVQTFKRQLHSDKAVDPVAAQQAVMQIESHASSKGMMSDGPEISKAFQAQREENTTQDEPTIKEPVDDISAPNRIPPETF